MVAQGGKLPAWRKKQFEALRNIATFDHYPTKSEPTDLSGYSGYLEKPRVRRSHDRRNRLTEHRLRQEYMTKPRRSWRAKTDQEIEQSRPTMGIQELLDGCVEFTSSLIRSMEGQHSQAVKHVDSETIELCADTWAVTMKGRRQ